MAKTGRKAAERAVAGMARNWARANAKRRAKAEARMLAAEQAAEKAVLARQKAAARAEKMRMAVEEAVEEVEEMAKAEATIVTRLLQEKRETLVRMFREANECIVQEADILEMGFVGYGGMDDRELALDIAQGYLDSILPESLEEDIRRAKGE